MPRLTLEPMVAQRLVNLLATDDEFRNCFMSDTGAALKAVGHAPQDPAEFDAFLRLCCKEVKLASREQILSARSEILAMLTTGTAYTVPMMEAGHPARNLRAAAERMHKAA
ncbi:MULTISPECIES: NHLP-related RiPP peptide [unclassified Stenotrophomonas]|uniref:NHLP-related RiPP peptide n=1 Tax=unclassified Stenotrophomonas TaxID=196198 RepID=UPI000B72469A|nr:MULTISPECIES: NHLP-related RiPP peptide [unclassified Stenotrophomonas]SNT83745.1 putative modified peptide [Stenotrophomonas sp. CC120222-04]SNY62689.1 putative modified peptide [Stenotrophomonas sp. CC120223-11]